MGYIRAVCISEKKGTGKKNVGEAVFIEDEGLKGDAHAGKWHRPGESSLKRSRRGLQEAGRQRGGRRFRGKSSGGRF